MSKLLRLRDTLPLEQAASYLSQVLEDQVTVSDLYALAHEGQLRMSVGFPRQIWVQQIHVFESAEQAQQSGLSLAQSMHVERVGRHAYLGKENTSGETFDLSMLGGELELMRELAWGKAHDEWSFYFDEIVLADRQGTLWRPGEFGRIDSLGGEPNKRTLTGWYSIPGDAILCVRVSELNRLVATALADQADQASAADPADLPDELYAANVAFRAVSNGHGEKSATFKNRLLAYVRDNFDFSEEAVNRIATVANPDKSVGRKRRAT